MKNRYTQFKAEWEFTRMVKSKLVLPRQCKAVKQISKCMEELHFLISEINQKYEFTPDAAALLFEQYSSLHEKMIYEKYIKEDSF